MCLKSVHYAICTNTSGHNCHFATPKLQKFGSIGRPIVFQCPSSQVDKNLFTTTAHPDPLNTLGSSGTIF